MSTLSGQFSAVRKSQVEAQINFFQDYTARALEATRKLVELNLATTRASIEQSTAAVSELMTSKDPRDLIALSTRAQANFDTLLHYGRALAGISSNAALPRDGHASAAKAAPLAELPLAVSEKFTPEVAPEAPPAPIAATPKPIAKAAGKLAAAAPAKPAAAPVPAARQAVVVTTLKAVEAAPPPAPVSGKPALEAKASEAPAAKAKKKK